jgi:hypothetical protein
MPDIFITDLDESFERINLGAMKTGHFIWFGILLAVLLAACQSGAGHRSERSLSGDTLPNGHWVVHALGPDSAPYYKDNVDTQCLKGGYTLYYGEGDSTRSIYLKHSDTFHLLCSSGQQYGSFYHLGVPMDDFDHYLVLGHDNGNGSPYTYELFNKETGNNVLGAGNEFLGINKAHDTIFLLALDTLQASLQPLLLYNVMAAQTERFACPAWMKQFWEINLDTVTSREIIFSSIDQKGNKAQQTTYRRIH